MTIELCSIRGDCKLINRIHWDFIVDDERGSSLSMIHEDISYNDLIGVVLEDLELMSHLPRVFRNLEISFRVFPCAFLE